MKIAIFSDCYLDLIGGIISVINTEKAELEKRGHTVEVFSSAYPHSDSELKKLAKDHIYPVPSCKIFGRGLTPIARRPKVIEKWLLKNHPEIKSYDIYYIHYEAGCSIAGLRLAKKFHIPTIQVMHGREDVGEEKLIPFGFRTIVATLLNWFHSWYLPHPITIHRDKYLASTLARAKMWTLMINHANYADLVITPSKHFSNKLLHYGINKPTISLHHSINDALIEENILPKSLRPTDTLEIIWHSRVSGEKRPLAFLEALRLLQYQYHKTNYHLSVYGDGLDLKKAQKFVKRHKLNVTFYGVASPKHIRHAMEKTHLDVLVSYGSDTFGMTLIEATSAGIPSFIVDKDMEEILPKGSYIIAKDPSPTQMASALADLLEHPDKVTSMSQIALANRNVLRNSHKINQLERHFLKIIKNYSK